MSLLIILSLNYVTSEAAFLGFPISGKGMNSLQNWWRVHLEKIEIKNKSKCCVVVKTRKTIECRNQLEVCDTAILGIGDRVG